ncbi:MAG: hypothetical protein AB7E36_03700 [Salinivirgaceae bacterium]
MKQIVYQHSNVNTLNRRIATFYLVIMLIQIIPLEGNNISNIKVGAMAMAAVFTVWRTFYISKATIWIIFYLGSVLLSAVVINYNYRSSTLIYFALFLVMFNMYYGLINNGAFTSEFFIKLIKWLIYAYTITLIVQQVTNFAGIGEYAIVNKFFVSPERGMLVGNSLSLEPSHSGRILAFAFYVFLKLNELKNGRPLAISQLIGNENRWFTLGFLWSMTTMGSGTAFVALIIISLYFIKLRYAMFIVPTFYSLYIAIPYIDNFSLNRARIAIEATLTGDAEVVKEADGSAAVRINPMINTLKTLDLTDSKQWFGYGTDTGNNLGFYSEKKQVGIINDYGLLSFIIGVCLISVCCITRFFSIETLLILALLSFTASNIAYIWGCYMLLVPLKYFYKQHARKNRINTGRLRL